MDSSEFVNFLKAVPYMSYSRACESIAYQAISVGKGDYGTAFRLSDGRVGKIYKSYDLAYETFLGLIASIDNPHLPKIYEQGTFKQFSFVVLEFVNSLALFRYMDLSFKEITGAMTAIILGVDEEIRMPSSIIELSHGLKDVAVGFCLDFKEENFGRREHTIIALDPFTLRTKDNSHLVYVACPLSRLVA